MKTSLIFLALLIVGLSCGTNNKPLSDIQKEKIKEEVKVVVNTFIKGCEEINYDEIIEPFFDSPDFVYKSNGKILGYKECVDTTKIACAELRNQKGTLVDEKYIVLDNSTVIYTANSRWLINLKDGSSVLQDPWTLQFLFKKINSKWKIINFVESGSEKIIKASETSKELNQVDLLKLFIGSWRINFNKDTISIWHMNPYGNGLEVNYMLAAKGKTYLEAKQLWGYDKIIDKFIVLQMIKGLGVESYALWFTTMDKYVMVPYNEMSNPEKASVKWDAEFKSPDLCVETYSVNNKAIKTYNITRIK